MEAVDDAGTHSLGCSGGAICVSPPHGSAAGGCWCCEGSLWVSRLSWGCSGSCFLVLVAWLSNPLPPISPFDLVFKFNASLPKQEFIKYWKKIMTKKMRNGAIPVGFCSSWRFPISSSPGPGVPMSSSGWVVMEEAPTSILLVVHLNETIKQRYILMCFSWSSSSPPLLWQT